jgi:hypothetical protein
MEEKFVSKFPIKPIPIRTMAHGEITFIDRIELLEAKNDLRWKKDGNERLPSLRSPGTIDKEHDPVVIVMFNVDRIMDLAIRDPETIDLVVEKTSIVQ